MNGSFIVDETYNNHKPKPTLLQLDNPPVNDPNVPHLHHLQNKLIGITNGAGFTGLHTTELSTIIKLVE